MYKSVMIIYFSSILQKNESKSIIINMS